MPWIIFEKHLEMLPANKDRPYPTLEDMWSDMVGNKIAIMVLEPPNYFFQM